MSERWWVMALRGVCALVFGALTLLAPGVTLVILTLWFAAFAALDGGLALIAGISALTHHKHGWALVAEGALGLAVAAIVMAWPSAGIAGLVLLAAAWAIMTGAALLVGGLLLPFPAGKFLIIFIAVLSLLLGVVLIAHPVAAAVVLALWLGAYALISGVLMLVTAFQLRTVHTRGFG
jgi:uncharacterized membrane protein HdeD (DUF308 family)